MHHFIPGGLQLYLAVLQAEFRAQKAALKEQLAGESDPARQEELAAEIKQLRAEYRERVRQAPQSLY